VTTKHVRALPPEVVEARRSTAAAATIAFVGQGIIAVVDIRAIGFDVLSAVRIAHVALAACALVLLVTRRDGGLRVTEVAFALVAIPFVFVLAASEVVFASRELVRDQLSWYKLVMVGIAALAPASPRLPVAVVLTLGMQAVVLPLALGRPPTVPGEPWITIIFAVISIAMLVSRARRREAAASAAHLAARVAALERVTRLLLRVRDRANTPLQTITLCTELIWRRCPEQQRAAEAIQHAVVRLRRLSTALQRGTRSLERASEAAKAREVPRKSRR
jgi:hypothetical protein